MSYGLPVDTGASEDYSVACAAGCVRQPRIGCVEVVKTADGKHAGVKEPRIFIKEGRGNELRGLCRLVWRDDAADVTLTISVSNWPNNVYSLDYLLQLFEQVSASFRSKMHSTAPYLKGVEEADIPF